CCIVGGRVGDGGSEWDGGMDHARAWECGSGERRPFGHRFRRFVGRYGARDQIKGDVGIGGPRSLAWRQYAALLPLEPSGPSTRQTEHIALAKLATAFIPKGRGVR